jgi:hypothetical protein
MSNFELKDSGKKQTFGTGYQRDTQDGKPRFDLIPVACLYRVAELYRKGAEKYGERNWEKGAPISRFYSSLFRHLMAWAVGKKDEDHLAAVVWNAFGIMHHECNAALNDMGHEKEKTSEEVRVGRQRKFLRRL